MFDTIIAIQFAVGIMANGNVHEGFSPDRHNGIIFAIEAKQRVAKNIDLKAVHYSEIDDGFNSTDEDRTYFGIMYNF